MITDIYKTGFALLTDLYQLTMGYAYWKNKKHEQRATFNFFYRKPPFEHFVGVIVCGIAALKQIIDNKRNLFTDEELLYLGTLKGNDGEPLFEQEFLDYLFDMDFSDVEILAMEEGTVAMPNMPIIRVTGPMIKCQLLESMLLNIVNFQTLIATVSHIMNKAANGKAVMDFGLRRAQGIDGSLSASYAAYIGGTVGTSNVLAAKLYGIPPKGTHAHSYVMSHDSEFQAFLSYASAMPNNTVLLVDTYDTLQGVKNAITIAKLMEQSGHRMMGIRLDSGNLLTLSSHARAMLDAAGLDYVKIVVSNDLDTDKIIELEMNGAPIDIYGVGTRLVTSYAKPALGGVYKLAAIEEDGQWVPKVKLSNDPIKVSWPGRQLVYRHYGWHQNFDILCLEDDPVPDVHHFRQLLVPLELHDGNIQAARERGKESYRQSWEVSQSDRIIKMRQDLIDKNR